MQKITPYLWFDGQAEEAVTLYTSAFANSRIVDVTRYGDAGPGPSGTVMIAAFELAGQRFIALNGGPQYKFTPAISFFVYCDTREELDGLWAKLSAGGKVLMELDKYPFSERFGWVDDRFGVSWQLSLASNAQKILPFFLFVGKQDGKAAEAMNLYTSLFENARILELQRRAPSTGQPEEQLSMPDSHSKDRSSWPWTAALNMLSLSLKRFHCWWTAGRRKR